MPDVRVGLAGFGLAGRAFHAPLIEATAGLRLAAIVTSRREEAEGGGVVLDLGPHLVDQALVLFGPVERVYAELDRRRPGAEVVDDAFLALAHASGPRSHLWMSAVAPLHGPRFGVSGLRA